MSKLSQRQAYGEALAEIGYEYPNMVVCDADLAHATYTDIFKKSHPDKFFDFGIAESNMVCEAAGMAHCGLIPWVSTFAIFGTGRAFEQVRNAVCYVNANVKFGLCSAGVSTGEDGGSHQSIEDIALMRVLPNMHVFVPCDALEVKKAVRAAMKINGPVYIRIFRPVRTVITDESTPFTPGKANVMRIGTDICLMATGIEVEESLIAAEVLEKEGISVAVVNHHSIKPLDTSIILDYHEKMPIISVEEHSIIGGLGSAIAEVIAGKQGKGFDRIGVKDVFGKSGKGEALIKYYGLDSESIADKVREVLREK